MLAAYIKLIYNTRQKRAQLLLRWPRNQAKLVGVLNNGVDLCTV